MTQQQNYLRNEKRKEFFVKTCRFFILFLFFFLWEISSRTGFIDSFLFSSPIQLVKTTIAMFQNNQLLCHIGITLWETLASFFLVLFFSLAIALFLWICPTLFHILEPYFILLNSLPKSALAPLFIVWLGANQKTIIIAGMSVAIFGSILNIYAGFQEIDQEKLLLIYTLGGTRRDAFKKVVLPASVPYLLSNMKVNIGLCLVGVIIGEFIGAKQGLGYLIIYASQVFKMDWMIMALLLLCIMAMGLYAMIHIFEKKILKRY